MNAALRSVGDVLFGTDLRQRPRLMRSGLACLIMVYCVGEMSYLVWAGIAAPRPVFAWSVLALGGMACFFCVIRSGLSLRFRDPSLTLAQMAFAQACAALAYMLAGDGRGGVFPVVMVALMFGLFSLTPRQSLRISVFGLLLLSGAMVVMSRLQPEVYRPEVEVAHFLVIVTILPVVSVLAGQLTRLRDRLRCQRDDLEQALARINELALRDELTGLPNRRHILALLDAERERCERVGRSFCLAMLDLDAFKAVNDRHGHAVGDEMLRLFGREALSTMRGVDRLARWGGEEFLLLLPDTGAEAARVGVERLRTHVEALRLAVGDGDGNTSLGFTFSAGVVEWRAGESTADAIARADEALYQAKTQGRNRTVLG